jgi:uncharacterized alpha-E superfamily protein
MLSRTADHLYWMARYLERAECIARMIEAEQQLSMLPRPVDVARRTRRATLVALGAHESFDARAGSRSEDALEYLAFDRQYNGSIVSCIARARENARAVRGTVASEQWEAINGTWLECRAFERRSGPERIRGLCEFVRQRSHMVRGINVVAMLRDEAYYFMRLGTFLERADCTARVLDARVTAMAGAEQQADPYEWTVLLRTLSAFEAYRKLFREAVTPLRVAELLILRPEVPRSLRRCVIEVRDNIVAVTNSSSADTERRAGALQAALEFAHLEDLSLEALPEFLTDKIEQLTRIGEGIARDFLISDAAA